MTADAELIRVAVHRKDAAAVREPTEITSLGGVREFLFARITGRHDHEHSVAERAMAEWNQVSHGVAFLAAELGLAPGVAAAVRAADDYVDDYEPMPDTDLEAIAGVLADRRPPWLADFAARRLSDEFGFGFSAWLLARRLVRLGAIARPDVPGYALSLPSSLDRRYVSSRRNGWRPTLSIAEALLADPGLLEDEVWRLFTVPDVARELQRSDAHPACACCEGPGPGSRWSDGLAELSERGHLDRGRLIDAALDAFTRDFASHRVAWYAAFHDRMGPTEDEIPVRADRYLGLLAVSAKPGVTLGQRGCGRLLDAGLLTAERFLAAFGPALTFPQKSVAIRSPARGRSGGRAQADRPARRPRRAASRGHPRAGRRPVAQPGGRRGTARPACRARCPGRSRAVSGVRCHVRSCA